MLFIRAAEAGTLAVEEARLLPNLRAGGATVR
jgi:hypothetical protein